ncbi:hypothetical protein BpHYR1_048296 [Brachionus plicatilis]|uniref:Uncharacterized protein n=1 Tax=Brachionus plicatilis TaxID=10195 RepID=A0A3M7RWF0_BRAPC|nr:hypothetical protein BpHYR1_048296 [Brachionus plicatilis]
MSLSILMDNEDALISSTQNKLFVILYRANAPSEINLNRLKKLANMSRYSLEVYLFYEHKFNMLVSSK